MSRKMTIWSFWMLFQNVWGGKRSAKLWKWTEHTQQKIYNWNEWTRIGNAEWEKIRRISIQRQKSNDPNLLLTALWFRTHSAVVGYILALNLLLFFCCRCCRQSFSSSIFSYVVALRAYICNYYMIARVYQDYYVIHGINTTQTKQRTTEAKRKMK